MNVMYGVCVGSWARMRANISPRTEGKQVLGLSGQTSIAVAYEAIRLTALGLGVDTLILLHDDLDLIDPTGEEKLAAAITDGADLVGVAGGSSRSGIGWWAQDPVGCARSNDHPDGIDFGVRSGDVECLDGCLLALSRWSIEHLSFDHRYPGFHGYDADISAQVRQLGRRVTVVDVDTWHRTNLGFKSPSSESDWYAANTIFREKWGLNA